MNQKLVLEWGFGTGNKMKQNNPGLKRIVFTSI